MSECVCECVCESVCECEGAQLLCRLIAYPKLCVCAAFAPKIALATRLTPLRGDTSGLLPLAASTACVSSNFGSSCVFAQRLAITLSPSICVCVCGWAIRVDQLGQHLKPKNRERERERKDDNSKQKLKRNSSQTA